MKIPYGAPVRKFGNTDTDVLSIYYEHKASKDLRIIQQFPSDQIAGASFWWDAETARLVLIPRRKPLGKVSLADLMPSKRSGNESQSERQKEIQSVDRCFWVDF